MANVPWNVPSDRCKSNMHVYSHVQRYKLVKAHFLNYVIVHKNYEIHTGSLTKFYSIHSPTKIARLFYDALRAIQIEQLIRKEI